MSASAWRYYHEETKHTVEQLRASRHYLDWANMPEPFRHYEGVPVVDLPADAPAPEAGALAVLRGEPGRPNAADGAELLSQLLFHSASISATKFVASTGYRYALRVNPSSGNLHPTEFHFATRGLADWPDGLYHYRVSSHMAEQRARGDWTGALGCDAPLVFVLTSIAWREAWKYRSRAYRYCLHDMGHAWEAVALAARACGYRASACGHFADQEIARALGVEDEWPMLIVAIDVPAPPSQPGPREWLGGVPNRLSEEIVPYPLIDQIHAATRLASPPGSIAKPCRHEFAAPAPAALDSAETFAAVVRRRRSALDFRGGSESISRGQLITLLECALRPHGADFEDDLSGGPPARFVDLWLYVHRVRSLEPGVYRSWLELVRPGDHRVAAAGLSLGQELAGNSCVTFSMIADLDRATTAFGDRGYRYAHFEAGAIGQRLYLVAEAMGFQSTGIGAFYDDAVHRYLDIEPSQGQVIYHFACGYAVKDHRLAG